MTLLVFGSAISDGQHLQSVKSIRYLIWDWLDRALIVYWKSTKTVNPLLASIPQMALKNISVSFGVLYCQSMEFLLKPVWVSHLTAKCELELVYKFLTVLQMRPQRKNVIFSWSFTVTSLPAFFFPWASVPRVTLLLERFNLSLRSTILILLVIKKISSLNWKSLPKSDFSSLL